MPPIIGTLAYLKAGGPFRGAAAARYAYERAVAEGLLAIRLMDARLRDQKSEIRSQRSEVRDQRSESRSQRSEIGDN